MVVGNALVNHLFFADDICLLSPSFSGLQDLVDICSSYAMPHNIVFNRKKSVDVLFPSKGFVLSQSPKIVLGNKVINFRDSVTYLGVKISANLSDDEDIFRQVRSSYCAANKLKAKFSKCSYVVKNMLFCSYCMPFYACHLWNNFRKSSYNRIKVAYNDAYRILHNLPRFVSARELQVSFGITTFEALQRKYMFSFVSRLLQSENCLIANLMNSDAFYNSEYFKSFQEHLYAKY